MGMELSTSTSRATAFLLLDVLHSRGAVTTMMLLPDGTLWFYCTSTLVFYHGISCLNPIVSFPTFITGISVKQYKVGLQ